MEKNFYYDSPIGVLCLQTEDNALTGLGFEDREEKAVTFVSEEEKEELPVLKMTCRWLDLYFAGKEPDFTPPVLLKGTDFRKKIWELLKDIPYGTTVSYKDVTDRYMEKYGKDRMAAQAVGQAIGHNPVSLIIPCHRVIGSDGSLTGYGGGLERKVFLLKLEKGE